jgi:hypothetical protein
MTIGGGTMAIAIVAPARIKSPIASLLRKEL